MQYNPQYCTIVVRNTDGSGYLRQFETLAGAKDAYALISASGAAVYLYQPPTRSLASFEAGSNVPDYDNGVTYGTGDQVKFQGKIYQLNNFIGAAGYTPASHPDQWTEVTSFTPPNIPPISNTASEVVEDGITRNPFNFTPTENTTTSTMSKIGCEITQEKEADGYLTFCSIYPKYRFSLPDGTVISEELGEKDTNGCHYPAGFKINFTGFGQSFREVKILNSLDYGGTIYGPYYQVDTYMGSENSYEVADGYGGKGTQTFISVRKKDGDLYVEHYFQDGDTPYKTSDASFREGVWETVGHPVPNGDYLVTYKVTGDERIHSGRWKVSIENAGSYPRGKWVFTPEEPDQPPPPPCSILRKVTNPISGSVEDQCDPDVVYPFSVEQNCEEPATVIIDSQTFVVGTNKKKGMDNGYGDVVWGECSGMVYLAYGTLIYQGSDLKYLSDGQGYYYTESVNPDNPCTPSGTLLSEDRTDITVDINGSNYTVGYSYERTVADGNCGESLEVGSEYTPSGTFITEDAQYNYYSDGSGDYYTEEICTQEGTLITSSTEYENIYISEIDQNVNIGSYQKYVYADGSCGTYNSNGEINYEANGNQIASGNGYNFYSNGSGGYYSEPIPCTPEGELIDSSFGGYLSVYISEIGSSYNAGSTSVSTYADGACGTYTSSTDNWDPYGTFITSDANYNYYSDGNGAYYAESTTSNCDPSGSFLSGNNSTIYVNVGCGDFSIGDYYESTYADGNCGSYTESGSNYYSYGTYIGNCNGNNYYSDGIGSYYSESDGSGSSYSPYGESTGNSGSGDNYIEINGSQYSNGTYSYTEYHDGMGGYYTEYYYSYPSYGYYLGGSYYADGSGGYYEQY